MPVEMRHALNLTPGKKLQINFDGDTISISKPADIKDVRRILQEEMSKMGTTEIKTQNGDGWTAHVTETFGKTI